MSTDMDEGSSESLDQVFPEDGVDIGKVTRLDDLARVAGVNTKQIRDLQRRLVGCREDPNQEHLIDPLEQVINLRQARAIRLVRQRTLLQEKENAKKKTVLEEALRPTVGALNNDRRQVLGQVVDMCERLQRVRAKYTEQTAEQRRLAARLKQWESFLLAMARGLDQLLPLPTDLE